MYLGVSKCWEIPGKGVRKVSLTDPVSELYEQRM
jgi:hypothetical protein